MTDSIPSREELDAALAVIKGAGVSVAEVEAGLQAWARSDVRNASILRPADHRCHRCDGTPTHQWARRATDQEAEDWHTAREQHIRAHNDGRAAAGYVSDRSDTVTMAVHGCDEHNLAPEFKPADGTPEDIEFARRASEQAGAALRVLLHDADCGGHGACGCGGSDA